jgi:transposase-like protein
MRGRLQDVVRATQLSVLPLEPLQLRQFIAGRPRTAALVPLGLADPQAKRLGLRAQRLGRSRTITTGSGPIRIEAPRVNDRRVDPDSGDKQRFRNSIVPPWARKSPNVAEVMPLLYLHGLSTGDFAPALEEFFGSAAGLSASVITRLTTQWQAEHRAFMERDLADRDYVYCWVDGVHFNVRVAEDRLCCLVIVGVRSDGTRNWSRSPTKRRFGF